MSTTTIRIPEELKARVASAAEKVGVTSHSFILQAIAEKTQREELHRSFEDEAEKRYANIVATGETISWDDMRSYLESYVAGDAAATQPLVKNWGEDDKIELAPEVRDDIARILDHLAHYEITDPGLRIQEIIQAIAVLEHNPLIGRPLESGNRELIIGQQTRGYLALYKFIPGIDTVFVLAIRSQKELGY